MKLPKKRVEQGFSLLEVLVATGLMAVLAAIHLQVMTMGLRAQKASLDQTKALEVAGQVLQEYSREALLVPGAFQGSQGPFAYVVSITPQYQVAAGRTDNRRATCYLLNVSVTWQERGKPKSVQLSTMRTLVKRAA
jgi:prepilin-type N-terminal cleavage/methylation domain-containing protein